MAAAASATDAAAAEPATHRAVRTLIPIPPASRSLRGARGPDDPRKDHARPTDGVLASPAPIYSVWPPPRLTRILTCSLARPAAARQGGHPAHKTSCQHPPLLDPSR